jgi:hypothetical protein
MLAVSAAMGVLLWLGLRNRYDATWQKAGGIVRQDHFMLEEAVDSLRALYATWHPSATGALPGRRDSTAFRLIATPTIPNIEWTKFRQFCQNLRQQRFLVLAGVTSTGATNLATRAARLLAGDPARLLLVDCSPQFDLELHKKYIGHDNDQGVFHPGILLQFWERCHQSPGEHFVAVIDNFDKINPETFLGPELWEAMSSSSRSSTSIGGMEVRIPANFHLISVTHLGPGSRIEFNEEHFKRLGRQYVLEPNAAELTEYLRRQATRMAAQPNPDSLTRRQLAALRDTQNLHRLIFYFLKTNEMLADRYGEGYQLGQGSNLRRFFSPEDLPELKKTYLNHINGLRPARPLLPEDFRPLDYTVEHNGLQPRSNFIARQVQFLYDTGYFVEITMVLGTALLTFLIGWWVFRRRERLIRHYGDRTQQIFYMFEHQQISADTASRRLEAIKIEVDALVLRRRLNYTEGLYFLAFIEDKVKRIEFARNVSENFLELFNTFMEDNILTENEYLKLRQFLQSIRHKIPEEVFQQFQEKVEQAYG